MALNDVIYNKKVDVAQAMPVPVVFAKQNDNAKRKVVVTLVKNGQPFALGTGVNGYIQGATAPNPVTKRQVKFKRDLTAIDTTQGTATFIITESMTAEIGITQCEVSIYDTEKPQEILCTANINIEVQGTGMSLNDEMASDDYQAIVNIKAEVTAMRDEVVTKTAQAIAAQSAAETAAQNAYNSALNVQKIVAGNEAYTKQEADLKYSVAPRKAQSTTTGEMQLTDTDDGLAYLSLEGNSEQYTNMGNKNLIDLHFCTYGYIDNTTPGTPAPNAMMSGFIRCDISKSYILNMHNTITMITFVFYDKDKNRLGDIKKARLIATPEDYPSGTYWMRVNMSTLLKDQMQLEEGTVNTAYVQGAVDTPSPDYPSEVKSVGDIPKDSNGVEIRNIIDILDVVEVPDSEWQVTGGSIFALPIRVEKKQINGMLLEALSFNIGISMSPTGLTDGTDGFYLKKNQINGLDFSSVATVYLFVYTGVVEYQLSDVKEMLKNSITKIMVTYAAEIDEYRPYIGENNGLVKLESTGKNLFPGKGVVIGNIGAGGIPGSITKVLRTDFIKIDNNKQYVFNPGTYVPYVYLYGSNKEYIKGLSGIPKFNSENADYVILQFNSKAEAEQTQNDVDKMNKTLQLEEGTQSTEYQPYHQQITWIPLREPLRKITGSGTYQDSIDQDGFVTQCILKCVLDGSIGGIYGGPTKEDLIGFNVNVESLLVASSSSRAVWCNKLAYLNTPSDASREGCAEANMMLTIIVKKARLESADLAGFKKWLSDQYSKGEPVIAYPATITPIAYQIPAVYIETYEPTTNVRCMNEVKPSTMGLDYKLAISSLIKRLEALETTAVQEVTRNV